LKRKRVLVAPLNWGLGHATRCIPVIREFLRQEAEVFIASDGRSLDLLKAEFPSLKFFNIPGYDIQYPENNSMVWKMLFSLPKILASIKKEHAALEKIINDNNIDVVVSDNRYGCWSKSTYSVFVTHQINIQVPEKLKWMQPFVFRTNKNFISKYNECWVPDFEGEENLSGKLSHQTSLKDLKYIGPLSRFNPAFNKPVEIKYDLLIICSGPEPQRTLFEKLLTTEILKTNYNAILVKGITESGKQIEQINNLQTISFAEAHEMQSLVESSSIIVSRPGYSTIMDLATSGKHALFIPTPGQTEQEYLADHFLNKKVFYSVTQDKFNFEKALHEIENYAGLKITMQPQLLTAAITSILSK
jgi:uncharacterized protein (TIGR00661 family)